MIFVGRGSLLGGWGKEHHRTGASSGWLLPLALEEVTFSQHQAEPHRGGRPRRTPPPPPTVRFSKPPRGCCRRGSVDRGCQPLSLNSAGTMVSEPSGKDTVRHGGMAVGKGQPGPKQPLGSPSPQHGELSGLGSQELQSGNGDGLAGGEARSGQSRKSTWRGSSGWQCPVT